MTAQVALALVLLFGAGLLVRSFTALRSAQVGFVADPVLVASLAMPASRYEDRDARSQLMERLKVRLEADPRVRSVSAVSTLPLSGDFMDVDIRIPGQTFEAGQKPTSGVDIVMPDYFESMGIPLTAAGSRDFDERDRREAPKVAVINQVMANRFWLGENPVGRVFTLGSGTAFEIVGVAGKRATREPESGRAIPLLHPVQPVPEATGEPGRARRGRPRGAGRGPAGGRPTRRIRSCRCRTCSH